MPSELDALIALADDLHEKGQRAETLSVIENIYALYDLKQRNCNDISSEEMITNHKKI